MNRALKAEVRRQLHRPCHSEEALQKLLGLAAEAPIARKSHIPFWELLLEQVRFAGWKIWACQAVVCTAIWAFLVCFGDAFAEDRIPQILGLLSLCAASMVVLVVHRSIRFGMQELESSTWLSARRLLLLKGGLFYVGDLLLLSLLLFAPKLPAGVFSEAGAFWLTMPGVLTGLALLRCLRRENLERLCRNLSAFCLCLGGGMCLAMALDADVSRLCAGKLPAAAAMTAIVYGVYQIHDLVRFWEPATMT